MTSNIKGNRWFTLLQRELLEHRGFFFWTPLALAISLSVLMLGSVLLADRLSAVGDAVLEALMREQAASGMAISIEFDHDSAADPVEYAMEPDSGADDAESWNFSREWSFEPKPRLATGGDPTPATDDDPDEEKLHSLNVFLNGLHSLFLVVLVLVSFSYLLGTLFNDRRDRSILFWKSLPVSEWEEVLAKLGVALLVVPGVYIGLSMVTQLVMTLLAMWLVAGMDMDPVETLLDNIQFVPLYLGQVWGWLLTALWVFPLYTWLLLASAAARRSPFLLSLAPVLGLFLLEKIFLGSGYLAQAVFNHMPHLHGSGTTLVTDSGDTVGFYVFAPDLGSLAYGSLLGGVLVGGLLLWATVFLRKYRFDL